MNTLITGASSGLGEALALASATRGETLFLCGRNAQRLADVANRCQKLGSPAVHFQVIDIRNDLAVREWIQVAHNIAPLDRVFANAGVSTGKETEDNIRNTFTTNVNGTINTVLAAINVKAKQIVITASIAGYGPLTACPSYSATKSCLKTWGLALRGQLSSQGIKVNVVCPGFVRSRITDGNTCPMPFFLEADIAARKILHGVDCNRGLIAFPWPMRLASWWLSTLPFWLNEFINRLLPKKML